MSREGIARLPIECQGEICLFLRIVVPRLSFAAPPSRRKTRLRRFCVGARRFGLVESIEAILRSAPIRAALELAWRESQAGSSAPHEEGGFIVQDTAGAMGVLRWPRGQGSAIEVPPHPGCRAEGLEIIASFHTHPNVGPDYLQEPGETDRRAVRDDRDLKASHYAGELVISASLVYLISPDGRVGELGDTQRVLGQA